MSLETGIQQIKNNLEVSYLFTKYEVYEDEQAEESHVIVKLWCINITTESSQLTKILRVVRKNVPATHTVKMRLFFNM